MQQIHHIEMDGFQYLFIAEEKIIVIEEKNA